MMDYENYNEFENYEDEDDNVTVWDGVKAFLSGVWDGMKFAFLITGMVITVFYWIGHPEWVLKKRFCDMIIKNCGKE